MQDRPFDSKFSALDLNKKQVSINDVVKITKGPSEVFFKLIILFFVALLFHIIAGLLTYDA